MKVGMFRTPVVPPKRMVSEVFDGAIVQAIAADCANLYVNPFEKEDADNG